jgi:3-hydroxyisobutyrate dehydrogenase-like beta-hydroxyacid dehydrogenase
MSPSAPSSSPPSSRTAAAFGAPKGEVKSRATHSCVGVIGLGRMGDAFAHNLVADGYRVLAYDRLPERVAALQETDVEGVAQLADLALCDLIVPSLPDDQALKAVALEACCTSSGSVRSTSQ